MNINLVMAVPRGIFFLSGVCASQHRDDEWLPGGAVQIVLPPDILAPLWQASRKFLSGPVNRQTYQVFKRDCAPALDAQKPYWATFQAHQQQTNQLQDITQWAHDPRTAPPQAWRGKLAQTNALVGEARDPRVRAEAQQQLLPVLERGLQQAYIQYVTRCRKKVAQAMTFALLPCGLELQSLKKDFEAEMKDQDCPKETFDQMLFKCELELARQLWLDCFIEHVNNGHSVSFDEAVSIATVISSPNQGNQLAGLPQQLRSVLSKGEGQAQFTDKLDHGNLGRAVVVHEEGGVLVEVTLAFLRTEVTWSGKTKIITSFYLLKITTR